MKEIIHPVTLYVLNWDWKWPARATADYITESELESFLERTPGIKGAKIFNARTREVAYEWDDANYWWYRPELPPMKT